MITVIDIKMFIRSDPKEVELICATKSYCKLQRMKEGTFREKL